MLVGVGAEQVMEEEEAEGQVVVVGLRPVSLDDDGDDDVCYTELKPSTTLLVPIELATEHQELLHTAELPDVALPVGSNNFSLMLEADDEEPEALEMDAENYLTLEGNMAHAGDMEEGINAKRDDVSVEHAVLEPDEEMLKMEELPSETVGPDVEANKQMEKVHLEQEMTESEPIMEYQPDEPADGAQAEQMEEKMELRPDSDPANEAQTEEEPVKEETFDVTDVCASGHVHDSGLAIVQEDRLVHDEKPPDEEGVVEASEMVPLAEDHVSEANRAEEKDAAHKEASEDTAESKKTQQSPARKGRKTVTFPITMMESEKDASEEERADAKVPSTPRRVTRSSKQLLGAEVPITPRRSTRKTDSEVKEEEVPSTKATPPRKTPQKTTPRRGSRKTRGSSANDEVQQMEETSVVEHQSPRKSRKVAAIEVPESIPEEKSVENHANASPGRITRQSSRRLSLMLESFQMVSDIQNKPLVTPPRSRRKTSSTTEGKTNHETLMVDGTRLQNVSRQLTRSLHWNDGEEPEKPENLESTNLLESALMERLNDEQAKASEVVTEIVRAKRRSRSVAPPVDHEEQSNEALESAVPTEQQEQTKKSAPSVRRTRSSRAPEPDPVSDGTPGPLRTRGERPLSPMLVTTC